MQKKFSTTIGTFLIFQPKKVFANSLNTFEDIAFRLGQCKGKSWNFYIFWILESCNVATEKTKISVHKRFSTTLATFHIVQPKKRFWKFLNSFEDIAFLPGQCKGKIEIFTFSGFWKILTLLLQNRNICAQDIFNRNSHLPHLSAKKGFCKFVKYFWRYSISARTVKREKLKFLDFCMLEKF